MFLEGCVDMVIDTDRLVAMTEANQNFSKLARMVDDDGMVIILRNNKPTYVLVAFDEYEVIKSGLDMRKEKVNKATTEVINENIEAFRELAK